MLIKRKLYDDWYFMSYFELNGSFNVKKVTDKYGKSYGFSFMKDIDNKTQIHVYGDIDEIFVDYRHVITFDVDARKKKFRDNIKHLLNE